MSLTRIDCLTYNEKSEQGFYEVIFNPLMVPGCAVIALSSPASRAIGSQVATQLALQYFVEGIMDFCKLNCKDNKSKNLSHDLIASGLKNANRSVYDFGHKLSAGGRMKAFLTTLAISNNVASVARVGGGDVYLYRQNHLYSFFDDSQKEENNSNVGQNSLISVQFSDIDLEKNDKLILFPYSLSEKEIQICENYINKAKFLNQIIFDKMLAKILKENNDLKTSMLAQIGEDAIFLS